MAQLSHVTIWSILKMSLIAMFAVQTLILQEGHLSGVNITRKRPMTRWEGFSEHVFASLASITWSKISDQELFGHREVSQEHMVPWLGYHCHLCVIWSVVILSILKTLLFSLRRWWSCGNILLWLTKNIRKYICEVKWCLHKEWNYAHQLEKEVTNIISRRRG